MGNYYVVFNDSAMIINPLFTHGIPTIYSFYVQLLLVKSHVHSKHQ